MNLHDVSKLSPGQQRAVMADQKRASAARERIMAQMSPTRPGIWWCNSHQRPATHLKPDGTSCCDPKLGGITLPCFAVFVAKPANFLVPPSRQYKEDAGSPPAPLSVPARGIPKGPKVSETHIQQAVIRWFDLHACEWNLDPELLMGFPLQGRRTAKNGARLKSEGMRKGTPDMLLAVPRGDCCSLWIENKSSTGKLSEAQKLMLKRLTAVGAATVVCRSAAEAQAAITAYLNLPTK